jgi:hypothetical protein
MHITFPRCCPRGVSYAALPTPQRQSCNAYNAHFLLPSPSEYERPSNHSLRLRVAASSTRSFLSLLLLPARALHHDCIIAHDASCNTGSRGADDTPCPCDAALAPEISARRLVHHCDSLGALARTSSRRSRMWLFWAISEADWKMVWPQLGANALAWSC